MSFARIVMIVPKREPYQCTGEILLRDKRLITMCYGPGGTVEERRFHYRHLREMASISLVQIPGGKPVRRTIARRDLGSSLTDRVIVEILHEQSENMLSNAFANERSCKVGNFYRRMMQASRI